MKSRRVMVSKILCEQCPLDLVTENNRKVPEPPRPSSISMSSDDVDSERPMVLQFTRLFLTVSCYPPFLTSPSPSLPSRTKVTKRECLLSVPTTEATDGTTGTGTETEVTTEVQVHKIHCLLTNPKKRPHLVTS